MADKRTRASKGTGGAPPQQVGTSFSKAPTTRTHCVQRPALVDRALRSTYHKVLGDGGEGKGARRVNDAALGVVHGAGGQGRHLGPRSDDHVLGVQHLHTTTSQGGLHLGPRLQVTETSV